MQTQTDLLEIIHALGTASGLASCLHRRQQQGHQDADDGDHHQQLDQRKTASMGFHGFISELMEKTNAKQQTVNRFGVVPRSTGSQVANLARDWVSSYRAQFNPRSGDLGYGGTRC
jgi:hypothetical protein